MITLPYSDLFEPIHHLDRDPLMMNESTSPSVRMSVKGHVCVISLDNAAKKNAISPEMMQELSRHLTAFDDDDDVE